jgi:ABC-type multidrug transport system fused ATPase/permease subunit
VAANHRWIWYIKNRYPYGHIPEWGSEPTPPVPRIPLTVAQRLLRILILIVGALTLIVICGPLEVTRAIWSAVSFMGNGPASSGAFFQLMIYLIMFALLGALFLADSWLSKRRVLNETDQFAHDLRLNWYTAVITGWIQALLLGLLFAYMVIAYM